MKKVARMLRKHRPLPLTWFLAKKRISSGVVEGLNNRLKLTLRKPMASGLSKQLKSRSTILLETYPNQNGPTNSAKEPKILDPRRVPRPLDARL